MSVDLAQFIPSFLEESFEGLELMESSLLNMKQGDDETINSIFRAAHSIKGGAGTFGFEHLTEFTHLVETLLDEMRDGRREINQADIEILLGSVDCMRLMLEAIRDNSDYDEQEIIASSKQLALTLANSDVLAICAEPCQSFEPITNNVATLWQITFSPEHHLVKTGNDPIFLFSALAELGELTVLARTEQLPALDELDAEELYITWQLTLTSTASEQDIREVFEWVEDDCLLEFKQEEVVKQQVAEGSESIEQALLARQAAPLEVPTAVEPAKSLKSSEANVEKTAVKNKAEVNSIRVGVDKVDNLINLVGELVITQSMLAELGHDFDEHKLERLNMGLEQLLQNTKELQESVMKIRMLPISFAFNRFPRLIHDLAKKTGKDIALIIKGEQTELDKTVMEKIGDPLVHLVRNAVDHGIESADVRLAHGKPGQGTIVLDAYHQSGNIVIEISDDGGGINRQVVFDKALEKGLVELSANLTDSQVFDLLFEPGFSTAKTVSDISGRGVGMDVVKRNIQALGGRIQIESTLGQGSTFRVHLPLTLAILDGQLVKVGDEVYIIPLITIVESLQTTAECINRVSGDMVLYRLRDENIPVLPIYELFNIPTDVVNVENALLVVVEADGQKVALMVDDLLAQQQVVIKSLQDNYQQVNGISGATILGDGSVAMILDVSGMFNMALKNAQLKQGTNSLTSEVLGESMA